MSGLTRTANSGTLPAGDARVTDPESANESPGLLLVAYGVSGLLLCVVVGAVVFAQCSTPDPAPPTMPSVAEKQVAEAEPTASLVEMITEAQTEREAVALVRPQLFRQNADQGGAALIAWSALRMTWPGLATLPESSFARAQKDVARELGKRICAIGTVSEIEVDHTVNFPLASGGLVAEDGVFQFYAVRSTRDVLEGRNARLCGIVTGRVTFMNALGSNTRAVSLVGMFDLPENRKAVAAR